jgi:hypothetical protein
MATYIMHEGELVEVRRVSRPPVFPGIIRDSMDATMHPCDGQLYESKSQFRRITAEHGCVELGNDAPIGRPAFEPIGVRDDIETAVQMLNQGYRPEPDQAASTLDGAAVETRMLDTEN